MRRREFITVLGGAAASWPLAARAQPAGPVRLIGVLMDYAENDPASQSLVAVFRDELAKLGWKEGGNLRIEVRWSAGGLDRGEGVCKRTGQSATRRATRPGHARDHRPCSRDADNSNRLRGRIRSDRQRLRRRPHA